MTLPEIPFELFFTLLSLLTAVDGWTTYKALKSGRAKEVNPVMKKLFDGLGVQGGLTLAKAGGLYLVWTTQPHSALNMWVMLAVYLAVAVNNLRVLKKAGIL